MYMQLFNNLLCALLSSWFIVQTEKKLYMRKYLFFNSNNVYGSFFYIHFLYNKTLFCSAEP